jgi:exopolyphosphatase/guanosine-5'-triphosphate,3'-diphosphate pyrophosphatase
VIDVGSNSVLLLTAALDAGGAVCAVDEATATTRLGRALADGGALDAAARRQTREAVVRFAARARARGAAHLWGFGTGAMRAAADGRAFAAELATAAGLPVEVLDGDAEAALAWAAASAARPGPGPRLVADVGGRTTELALGGGAAAPDAVSLRLGALALTEAHLRHDPPSAGERRALADAVRRALATTDLPARAAALGAAVVASGGTATALAALDLGLDAYDPSRVHGHRLASAALADLAARLAATPARARVRRGAVDAGRAAILPAGAAILVGLVEAVAADAITVSHRGVRHAYLAARLREGLAR